MSSIKDTPANAPFETPLTIAASNDGFPLFAIRYDPPSNVRLRVGVVFVSATGLDATFYAPFSRYLAQSGVGVLTFDYRYTGQSWPKELAPLMNGPNATPESRLRGMNAVPRDIVIGKYWGWDAAGVTKAAAAAWPSVALVGVGHSVGGNMLTLIPHEERRLFSRFLNITGGNIFFGNLKHRESVYNIIARKVTPYIESDGAVYMSRAGFGTDLPYSIGIDWIAAASHPRGPFHTEYNRALHQTLFGVPYLIVGFEGDMVCNEQGMRDLMSQFDLSDSLKASLWIDPRAQSPPWPSYGHIESLVAIKTRSPAPASPTAIQEATIWPLYRDFILEGPEVAAARGKKLGKYKVWQPSDEADPLARADEVWELVPFSAHDDIDMGGKRLVKWTDIMKQKERERRRREEESVAAKAVRPEAAEVVAGAKL
ncbi:hypothetical protein DL93DRAFT_2063380 [Clavulina sp. PMI_390]|nr:hypothetical protein DL93DRAFT_2063380 [Clavulina sp. PMI_390]